MWTKRVCEDIWVNEPMYLVNKGEAHLLRAVLATHTQVFTMGYGNLIKFKPCQPVKKSRFDPWHLSKTTLWTNKSSPYVSSRPGGWVGERVHPAGISGVKRQFPNHSKATICFVMSQDGLGQ